MSRELRQALESVARRFRQIRLWRALALCWLAWALVGIGLSVLLTRLDRDVVPGRWLLGSFLILAAATGLACAFWALRAARDPRWVARRIEAKHPELDSGLLAAVDQAAPAPLGRLGYLQTVVIRKALDHARVHNWDDTVSTWTLRGTQVAHAVALGLLIVISTALVGQARSLPADRARPRWLAGAADVAVDPGDTQIERGTSLLVIARFQGAVPADAILVYGSETSAEARRKMTRSLEDPTFAARVETVDADLTYHVEFAGERTKTFRATVFEYPELERTDAKLVFPQYTSLEPRTIEDIRHVTAVEGTALTLLCRLNKDVASAKLVDENDQVIDLSPDDQGSHVYRTTFTLTDPRRFQVQLLDRDGRRNKLPSEIVVNVTRNRPPVITMSQPSRDVRVSPIEELKLKAQLEDDFGLVRHGLSYTVAGQPPREVVLPRPSAAEKRAGAEHVLEFETLKAQPGELVSYFFWAEDVGPDGQPRRASGDMFFAEVRHFEEIFRQGEQPSGGAPQGEGQQEGNVQEAEKLVDLQKQIINGTWKLIRRETGSKPTEQFAPDNKVLHESQQSAIEQAARLGERLRDPASRANLETATKFMKEAEKHLAQASQGTSVKEDREALSPEQAAYQALLKLRAREFQVVRGNSRQRGQNRGGGGGGPSQMQLQQLELADDENRYEQQSTARAQQEKRSQREQELGETRQVLNRLRELAQRQNDLNDRLKELQSALEAAKTPQAREEIERQLKRLRDQQQQILRDTDELRERMEREENRDRMADARQQIEQGREHVRQASQALEEGRLSQALTEGSRAGRQLNNLREDLRKGASNRFSEEMTEMREQAKKLDEEQNRISDALDATKTEPQHGLRDTGDRKQVQQRLEQQSVRLDQLTDQMRKTVQDAEETEPLLAKSLFDTVRKAGERKIPEALKVARQLVDVGVADDAAKTSRFAGKGLEELREGVERAAKSVLGDETAALRRAQGELDELADAIDREIAQANPPDPNDPERSGAQQGDPRNGRPPRAGNRPQAKGQQPGQGGQEQGERQGQPNGEQEAQPNEQQEQPREQQGRPGGQGKAAQKGQRGARGQQGQQQQQAQRGQGPLRGGNQPQGQGQTQGQGGQPQQPGEQPQEPQQGGQAGQGQQGRMAGNPQGGGGDRQGGNLDQVLQGLAGGPGGPITGNGFREWSDRMRDVEELLEDPDLRAEAARIRDRVRGAREEFRRHSKEPDWTQLQDLVAEPIQELRERVAEEVRRRESPDSLVPIDRDPVPPQFAEGVRRYYERLGSGR